MARRLTEAEDPTPDDYYSYPASSFFPPLVNDLKLTVDSTGRANLVLYIHGLGNTYSDALTAAANLGTTLQAAGYGGLVMGFSWPSYSELVAALTSYYATTRPPVATSGTIRDNINGSVGSFLAMLAQLQAIKINNNPINISVITHSEGNFMLMWYGAIPQELAPDESLLHAGRRHFRSHVAGRTNRRRHHWQLSGCQCLLFRMRS